jgi:archaellum biogenesis ATPase FlaH
MKYSELISFKPIESTIQLLETADKDIAREMVQTYVMSDTMADNLKATVADQLQMEEVVDNKAVMIVGNYGTGKSHLMSVIAAIVTDEEYLEYAQNKKFGQNMEIVAGKFEVLRLKVDGLTMPLREVILAEIEDDFANRGIDYTVPDLNNVRDNARLIKEVMQAFQSKYLDKGYLIVIDELLSYLTSRDERQIVLDLAFLQSMAEMCSKSKIRLICGVQEKVFDNPRFSFVSETLKKVGDRFTQIIITKEATAYVVSKKYFSGYVYFQSNISY